MSDIADRVLSKPRTCKKPAPAACAASREARDAKNAEESSEFQWIDFNFIVVGFPTRKRSRISNNVAICIAKQLDSYD